MTIEALIIWIVVGAVAGWLAGTIVKGYGFGLVGNVVVGIVGAFVASWVLPKLGVALPAIGSAMVSGIVYATIGAVILLLVVGLVRRSA